MAPELRWISLNIPRRSFAFYPELTRLNFDRCRVWSLALAALSIFSDILMSSVIFAPQDTNRTKCDRLSHKSLWSKWINFLKLLIGKQKACESALMLNKQKKKSLVLNLYVRVSLHGWLIGKQKLRNVSVCFSKGILKNTRWKENMFAEVKWLFSDIQSTRY